MKHLVATLALLAVVAGATGFISYRASGDRAVKAALTQQNAMEWLRTDFQLTDEQFTEIKRLHDSYSLVCEEHCREIQRAIRARHELKSRPDVDGALLTAADRRVEELRLICETAIARHVRECATHMSPDAGQRYLALVLPKIKDFDHQAPPDLRLNKHAH